MGLGKTLTMIALIATDLKDENEGGLRDSHYMTVDQDYHKPQVSATLVIIPPPRA